MRNGLGWRLGLRRGVAVFLCLALASVTTACETNAGKGALAGAATGAAAGGLADKGGLAGILIGAALGAFIGASIGNKLDEAEQAKAAEAARRAAESVTNSRVSWTSDQRPNVHGYAEPVVQPAPAVAGGTSSSTTIPDGCRKVREVSYVEGKETSEEGMLCLRGGRWQKS